MIDKDAYKLFWMVKGHIDAPHSTIIDSANSYFVRLWANEEAYYREEGFEEAWSKKVKNE